MTLDLILNKCMYSMSVESKVYPKCKKHCKNIEKTYDWYATCCLSNVLIVLYNTQLLVKKLGQIEIADILVRIESCNNDVLHLFPWTHFRNTINWFQMENNTIEWHVYVIDQVMGMASVRPQCFSMTRQRALLWERTFAAYVGSTLTYKEYKKQALQGTWLLCTPRAPAE